MAGWSWCENPGMVSWGETAYGCMYKKRAVGTKGLNKVFMSSSRCFYMQGNNSATCIMKESSLSEMNSSARQLQDVCWWPVNHNSLVSCIEFATKKVGIYTWNREKWLEFGWKYCAATLSLLRHLKPDYHWIEWLVVSSCMIGDTSAILPLLPRKRSTWITNQEKQ